MTLALTKAPIASDVENLLIAGDLSRLSADQRVTYYKAVCESVGLNPLTQPFQYLSLSGKLVLYARKDCTDQLRKIHGISIAIVDRALVEGVYVVTAQAADSHGRKDESIGAVPLGELKGEARANAMMKAETKSKRRATLSICGLGMLDETEVDSIPGAAVVPLPAPTPPPKWTSGTENVPKREVIKGFDDPDEEEQRLTAEFTENVDIVDPSTGEVIRQEPGITTAQNAKIHALLRDLRIQYPEARYRKDLKAKYCKEHTNELSVREASRVIEVLMKRYEKIRPEMEAQAADSAAVQAAREPGADDGE